MWRQGARLEDVYLIGQPTRERSSRQLERLDILLDGLQNAFHQQQEQQQ